MFNFKQIYDNNFCESIIIVFIILYIALLKPNLSNNIKNLFNNTIFKIVLLFFIIYIGNINSHIAILLALSFVLTLDCIHVMDSKEAFDTIEKCH